MATEKEIQIFRDLIEMGIDQDRAKRLIRQVREGVEPPKKETLATKSLRQAEEFIGKPVEQDIQKDTLKGQLQERGEAIKEAVIEEQTFFKPGLLEDIQTELSKTPEGQEINNKIETFNNLVNKIPGGETIKSGIQDQIENTLTGVKITRNVAGGVNDIIGAGVNKLLEITGADKIIEKGLQEAGKTKAGQNIGEILQKGSETFQEIEENIPGLGDILAGSMEVVGLAGFIKGGQVLTEATGKGLGKLPTPKLSVRGLDTAEKLVDTTLKFNNSQKKKFKQPALSGGKTPSQYLLEKGIVEGSKTSDDIVDKLIDLNKNSKKQVDEGLANIKDTYKNEQVNKGLDVITKQLSDVPGMEDDFNRVKELSLKAQRGEGLNLTEINELKRIIDDTNDLVKVTGEFKTGVTKQGLINIRQDIKKFIEDEADKKGFKNVQELNKDTQLSRELINTISGNLEESGRTRIFGLTDILIGGGVLATTDFGTTLAAVSMKKLIESERFKLLLAKKLNKLSATKQKDIKTKIESGEPLSGVEKALIISTIQEDKRLKELSESKK